MLLLTSCKTFMTWFVSQQNGSRLTQTIHHGKTRSTLVHSLHKQGVHGQGVQVAKRFEEMSSDEECVILGF